MKYISILGSTGSIGTQALDVVRQHEKKFQAVALSAKNNSELLEKQVLEFKPKMVCLEEREDSEKLRERIGRTETVFGEKGLEEVASIEEADSLLDALVGFAGLKPTLSGIKSGKNILLANKETLVAAGEIVLKEVEKRKVSLIPIDSEHSAIFQCLRSGKEKEVKKIIITCSGGPFKFKKRNELQNVSVEQALGHPTWNMGGKITIDSSTLMNKGLEVMEAHFLFGTEYERIQPVMHPQSIIHSMVEFVDGSLIAQLGTHDMHIPIQYALSYPERLENGFPSLDLIDVQKLEFFEIDNETFPSISYAFEAGRKGGTMPCVLNAANEEAVYSFLSGKSSFLQIDETVKKVMELHKIKKNPSLEEVFEVDSWARKEAKKILGGN